MCAVTVSTCFALRLLLSDNELRHAARRRAGDSYRQKSLGRYLVPINGT
jgi:hypothetical protein